MQRQRGTLVPISDALSGMDGPVKAIREASPQARHHFTLSDQVNQLVSAREADPDLGFMGRTMALCSLPRTNPGNRHQYKRVNGPFELTGTGLELAEQPFQFRTLRVLTRSLVGKELIDLDLLELAFRVLGDAAHP